MELAFKEAGLEGKWEGKGVDEKFVSEDGVLVQVNEKFYRPAEITLLYGDSNPARQELGWLPEISFEELVSRMVRKDLNN